ncbi:MAG: sigma-70 family RNA polymerase sigma factor [Rudaea sp.]|uniref:RNA polymerase sigma factor n=1 Tax=Rudaea sp. TaxID=2136325 RepID=UPI0039E353FC
MSPGRPEHPNETAPFSPAVYDRYAAALNRYFARRLRRPEDADDLVQEVFELFVKRKDRAEVIRNPLAYLFRIAFHVVGTALADDRRNPVIFDSRQLPDELGFDARASSSEDAEELVAQENVRAALEQLPAHYLTALMLVEGQGMSYKEAAKASGFTPNTIATYVMHGRAALKLALDGRWKRKPK